MDARVRLMHDGLIRQQGKGIQVKFENKIVWLPLSQVKLDATQIGIWMLGWLVKEKGLEGYIWD